MKDVNAPHPKNVAGDFYVVNGCCTACGVPEGAAPELFAWDKANHCFVKRQPKTRDDFERALHALRGAELQCIRYRGSDPDLMQRIADLGEPELCDLGPPGLKGVFRDHATFDTSGATFRQAVDAAVNFREFFLTRSPEHRVRGFGDSAGTASLSISWYRENYHPIFFADLHRRESRWLVRHEGHLGVSDLLHEWLSTQGGFSNIRWYSEESWNNDKAWQRTPW